MKIALAVLSLLALAPAELDAATDVPRLAITSPEKTSVKDDLGKENRSGSSWPANGLHRPSGGRQVLAQVAETQPAVAILEDQKFDDVDVTVRFSAHLRQRDAREGSSSRAKDGRNYLLVRANALREQFPAPTR